MKLIILDSFQLAKIVYKGWYITVLESTKVLHKKIVSMKLLIKGVPDFLSSKGQNLLSMGEKHSHSMMQPSTCGIEECVYL